MNEYYLGFPKKMSIISCRYFEKHLHLAHRKIGRPIYGQPKQQKQEHGEL